MLLIVITTLYVVIYVVFVDGGDVSGVNAYLRDVRVVEGKRRVIGGGVVWSHSHGYAGETTEKSPLVVPLTEVVVIERSVCMSE